MLGERKKKNWICFGYVATLTSYLALLPFHIHQETYSKLHKFFLIPCTKNATCVPPIRTDQRLMKIVFEDFPNIFLSVHIRTSVAMSHLSIDQIHIIHNVFPLRQFFWVFLLYVILCESQLVCQKQKIILFLYVWFFLSFVLLLEFSTHLKDEVDIFEAFPPPNKTIILLGLWSFFSLTFWDRS